MKKALCLAMFLPFMAMAQFNPPAPRKEKKVKDSLDYYAKQLGDLRKAAMDSLSRTAPFLEALAKYKQHYSQSRNYTGFTFFTDFLVSDYGAFNDQIKSKGFDPLNSLGLRLGMGISTKQRFVIFDFYFAVAGFNTKTQKGDEKIRASLSNVLQFDLGFDLLNVKGLSLYPYGGLSLRTSNLSYKKPEVLNPNYTDITDFVSNSQSVSGTSTKLGYQAGIGIDVVTNSRSTRMGPVLFVKAGINRPFGKENYDILDKDYRPGIKQGILSIAVGIKLASRD